MVVSRNWPMTLFAPSLPQSRSAGRCANLSLAIILSGSEINSFASLPQLGIVVSLGRGTCVPEATIHFPGLRPGPSPNLPKKLPLHWATTSEQQAPHKSNYALVICAF